MTTTTASPLVGLLDRLSVRKSETSVPTQTAAPPGVYPTKALRKFLASLTAREGPALLDLGPVIGANVSFFGEQLGCRIRVEDIYSEIDRHARDDALDALPEYLARRFPQDDASVDGILCWDLFDFLPRAAAQSLAAQLIRLLRPEGALLALYSMAPSHEAPQYTKYTITDDGHLMYRPYDATRCRRTVLLNRDIIRLFDGLQVADSFLLQNKIREILFRKPA